MQLPNINCQIWLLWIILSGGFINLQHIITHTPVLVHACPTRAMIKPCMCNEITKGLEIVCEGVRLENLRNVFDNLQKSSQTIMYLRMKNNHLQKFPSDLLNNLDVRHLMAHKCNMIDVDTNAFSSLHNKIQSIDFSKNKFKEIPSAIKEVPSLVSLNLNFNEIESINERAFDGLISLLILSLFGNKIANIHPQAFVGVGLNLTRINLGDNKLSSIPSEALSDLKSIQRVEVHENNIYSLKRDDFAKLQGSDNLDVLNLARNSIQRLNAQVFSDLNTLNSLDLDGNKIHTIENQTFNGLNETLEWLKLGDNQLKEIPTNALQNLTKLRGLDLRGNQIRAVYTKSFSNFGKKLKFLYLQKNKITTIEKTAFDNLESLEWLYLNSNQLKHISEQLFVRLTKTLLILDLHDNPIICSCDVLWYQHWIEKNSKNQIAKTSKETRCEMIIEQNEKRTVRDILIGDVISNIKCNSLGMHHKDTMSLLIVLLLACILRCW